MEDAKRAMSCMIALRMVSISPDLSDEELEKFLKEEGQRHFEEWWEEFRASHRVSAGVQILRDRGEAMLTIQWWEPPLLDEEFQS